MCWSRSQKPAQEKSVLSDCYMRWVILKLSITRQYLDNVKREVEVKWLFPNLTLAWVLPLQSEIMFFNLKTVWVNCHLSSWDIMHWVAFHQSLCRNPGCSHWPGGLKEGAKTALLCWWERTQWLKFRVQPSSSLVVDEVGYKILSLLLVGIQLTKIHFFHLHSSDVLTRVNLFLSCYSHSFTL